MPGTSQSGVPAANSPAAESALDARPRSTCFACGPENRRGLRLRFQTAPGEASATWMPESDFEGFRGIVHGGIVSTVLDEAMSKAVAASGTQALTAELTIRFREHVAVGASYQVTGRIIQRRRRLIEAEAAITAPDGTQCAHARGRFLALPGA